MPGPAMDIFIGAFGATTALLVVGGAVALRWQRAKLRHSLMLASLERGVPASAGMMPLWIGSLRQGVSVLVLGLVLMLAGAVAVGGASKVPMPTAAQAMQQTAPPVVRPPPEFGPDGRPRPAPPPPETPAMQQWHQAQVARNFGFVGLVCGLLLVALGLVRVIFAGIERKFVKASGLAA